MAKGINFWTSLGGRLSSTPKSSVADFTIATPLTIVQASTVIASPEHIAGLSNDYPVDPISKPKPVYFSSRPCLVEDFKPKPALRLPTDVSPLESPIEPLVLGGSFHLTPLSGLVTQSYMDIRLLRRAHTIPSPVLPSPAYSPATMHRGSRSNAALVDQEPGAQEGLINFDQVEDSLKKFDQIYKKYLKSGAEGGGPAEEVHLVAVVCKRSDIVKGRIGKVDDSVPCA